MPHEAISCILSLVAGFATGWYYRKHYSQKRDSRTGRFVSNKE